MNKTDKINKLLWYVDLAKGDDLEIITDLCSDMTEEQLNRPCGFSGGDTARNMLIRFAKQRAEWEEVREFVEELKHVNGLREKAKLPMRGTYGNGDPGEPYGS